MGLEVMLKRAEARSLRANCNGQKQCNERTAAG